MVLIGGCDPKLLPGGGSPGTGLPRDGVSQTIPFITGQLVDGAGQPVEGAAVRAYVAPYRIEGLSTEPMAAVETTTDAQGAFKLASPPLGSVAVEASGHGQKALRTGVTIKSGATVELGTLALQPTGRIAGRVTSSTGVSLLGTDVFIPGTDYLAKTAADGTYLIQDVPVGTYQLAAVRPNFQPRVLEGIQVAAGQATSAPDLELSLDAPVLTSLTPTSGGLGTVVTLTGTNFGASKQTVFQVTFGDTMATTVKRLSDTEIQATVPVGATTGGVIVRSNGLASTAKPFSVIGSLTLTPSSLALYPDASASFGFRALNEQGEAVSGPFVAWALRDPSIGTISAQGDFRAMGRGVTELTLRSGVPTAISWVGVSPYRATTLYGTGRDLSAGDGSDARFASFNNPFVMARDSSGRLYVGESSSMVIRRIAPDGIISRFGGNGTNAWTGDGGPALEAGLGTFSTIAIDGQDRLWVSDPEHHVLRFIPLDDRAAPTYRAGYIYRAAGTGVAGYSPSGTIGSQALLNAPQRVTAGPEGLYVADKLNHRIRLIDSDLRVTDVLGTGSFAQLASPTPETMAPIGNPYACAFDARGNMLISTYYQLLFWCRVSGTYLGRAMEAGTVYPIAKVDRNRAFHGDGEGWQEALHGIPRGLQPDGEGGFWFIDHFLVRHLRASGHIESVAGKPLEHANQRAFGPDGEGMNALRFSLANPSELLAFAGQLLVVDSFYCRIVRLEPLVP